MGNLTENGKILFNQFEKNENVLSKLTEEDAVACEDAKNLISKLGIKFKNNLIFISSNYGFLSCFIIPL